MLFLTITFEARRQCNNDFKILYPTKLAIKYYKRIKKYANEQGIKKYISHVLFLTKVQEDVYKEIH